MVGSPAPYIECPGVFWRLLATDDHYRSFDEQWLAHPIVQNTPMSPITPWSTDVHAIAKLAASQETVSWLLEVGSITARLHLHWPALVVHVLDEGIRPPTSDESKRLNLGTDAVCWVREVQLHSQGTALVHARTVIPDWGYHNPWNKVSTLGQRPLGELLFSLPKLQRSPLEFAWTCQQCATGCASTMAAPSRRRVFLQDGAPLLLTEAFDLLATSVNLTDKEAVAATAG